MARVPVITRTITTTKVEMLAVNVDSKSTETVEVTLPRTYKDEQAMLKMANKRNEDQSLKFVAVTGTPIVSSKRWGMTEEEFIDKGREFPAYKAKGDAGDLSEGYTEDVENTEA